ncbi:substrate-binding domain-containing protein [Streptomyces sp. NPDC005820]|uniref:substrate-binding domain-containing protein n=1 Tax=Streptomyces sp. NPDC005820 TaxID=3157069 RepID=UPI0033E4A6B2
MNARSVRGAVAVAASLCALVALSACTVRPDTGAGDVSASPARARNLKVGWSTTSLTTAWMRQTLTTLQGDVERLRSAGKVGSFRAFDADNDTARQIAQIRTMTRETYDVILVDAGSPTALDPALEEAVASGITVVAFDSLPTSPAVVKVGTDQWAWGSMLAGWLVDALGGEGDIIAMTGPAGSAGRDDRWSGAAAVFARYPGIRVVETVHSPNSVAPATKAFASAYAEHPGIRGVLTLGGTLSTAALRTLVAENGRLVPVAGENYNGFLKLWQSKRAEGFSGLATAQPDYLSVIALEAAVAQREGVKVPAAIDVPLPEITDGSLARYADPGAPDDIYPVETLPQSRIDELIGRGADS